MNETYYVIENGKLFRFKVEQDDYPDSPRCWDNLGHMICHHRNYTLGDEQPDSIEGYIDDLIRDNIDDTEIINHIKQGKSSNNLEIKYNKEDDVFELIGDYRVWWNGNKIHRGELANQPDIDWLVDDIIESLPLMDKVEMLERKDFVFIPLNIYDHSGITMYTGSIHNHFDSEWDCSPVGFIYTTREEALKWGYDIKDWHKKAEDELEAEVETYDMYLTGNVYGYILEEHDGDDFYEIDSCWGYYSDKYGKDLASELILDTGMRNDDFVTAEEANEYITRRRKSRQMKDRAVELVRLRKSKQSRR